LQWSEFAAWIAKKFSGVTPWKMTACKREEDLGECVIDVRKPVVVTNLNWLMIELNDELRW
jgi:hypothetical protein